MTVATIAGNFIMGYRLGVYQYEDAASPLFPPTPGTVIDSNVILTRDSYSAPYYTYGIQSSGPEDIIAHNLIITPASYRFIGVSVRGADSWIEANTVIPRQVVRQSYASSDRSVGIGIGNYSTGSTAAANRTYGLDVGSRFNPTACVLIEYKYQGYWPGYCLLISKKIVGQTLLRVTARRTKDRRSADPT